MIRNPQLDEYSAEKIVDFAKRVRDLHKSDELTTAVSTRMCLAVAELVVDGMSLIEALKHTCLPFYPVQAGDDTESKSYTGYSINGGLMPKFVIKLDMEEFDILRVYDNLRTQLRHDRREYYMASFLSSPQTMKIQNRSFTMSKRGTRKHVLA